MRLKRVYLPIIYRLLTQAKHIHLVYTTGASGIAKMNKAGLYVKWRWNGPFADIHFQKHVATFAEGVSEKEVELNHLKC